MLDQEPQPKSASAIDLSEETREQTAIDPENVSKDFWERGRADRLAVLDQMILDTEGTLDAVLYRLKKSRELNLNTVIYHDDRNPKPDEATMDRDAKFKLEQGLAEELLYVAEHNEDKSIKSAVSYLNNAVSRFDKAHKQGMDSYGYGFGPIEPDKYHEAASDLLGMLGQEQDIDKARKTGSAAIEALEQAS